MAIILILIHKYLKHINWILYFCNQNADVCGLIEWISNCRNVSKLWWTTPPLYVWYQLTANTWWKIKVPLEHHIIPAHRSDRLFAIQHSTSSFGMALNARHTITTAERSPHPVHFDNPPAQFNRTIYYDFYASPIALDISRKTNLKFVFFFVFFRQLLFWNPDLEK